MIEALRYVLPAGAGLLEFAPSVLMHFEAHKQLKCFAREAGGQLFATFDDPSVVRIVEVTGPRSTDRRRVFNYVPDRQAEREEIKERYARGLHFVGDWHTHKQRIPSPSATDQHSIRETVRCSNHDLAGFVLVVVGQEAFPDGLHGSFHSTSTSLILRLPE